MLTLLQQLIYINLRLNKQLFKLNLPFHLDMEHIKQDEVG